MLEYVKTFNLPMLVLGGGGYTIRNVARCWTFETAVILNEEISNDLTYNDYYEYYGPDYRLHVPPTCMDNLNLPDHLEKLKSKIFEHIKQWQPAPNVQMHVTPPDAQMARGDDCAGLDERAGIHASDSHVDHPAEYYVGKPGE